MIIVGTYPDGFVVNESTPKFQALGQILNILIPEKLGVHILPFYPNSGDFGFAPDDWFQIRNDLGGWEDLVHLASRWKIIVDGIYNHVGMNHKWVKEFLNNPDVYANIIHAYKTDSSDRGPLSPRGQPVLVESTDGYYLWKTFTDAAVDIRLENSVVQEEIDQHLDLLSSKGIWGIRLDAVAYYAKSLGHQIRHNPGVYNLANGMADKIRSHGLQVLVQLDCDNDGVRYYADSERNNIPINDFTYAAHLALSIFHEDPNILVNHVLRTLLTGRTLIRAPRTHDGIYLRSKLLNPDTRNQIISFAQSKNIRLRTESGDLYELNCSAPYMYSLIASEVELSKAILFTVAVTGMMPGWSYFYLPYIMGHIPEIFAREEDLRDPRAINRIPIPTSILEKYLGSPDQNKVFSLLSLLQTIHMSQGDNFRSNLLIEDKLLLLSSVDGKYKMVANFCKTKHLKIPDKWLAGDIVEYNDYSGNVLGGLGFVIISTTNKLT
jgi:sucrose phosphorylase